MNDDLNIINEQTLRIISDRPYTNTNISRSYIRQLEVIKEAAERMANRIAELEKAEPVVCDCCAFQPNCHESIVMTGKREYCDEWVTINSCSHGKRKPLEDK